MFFLLARECRRGPFLAKILYFWPYAAMPRRPAHCTNAGGDALLGHTIFGSWHCNLIFYIITSKIGEFFTKFGKIFWQTTKSTENYQNILPKSHFFELFLEKTKKKSSRGNSVALWIPIPPGLNPRKVHNNAPQQRASPLWWCLEYAISCPHSPNLVKPSGHMVGWPQKFSRGTIFSFFSIKIRVKGP